MVGEGLDLEPYEEKGVQITHVSNMSLEGICFPPEWTGYLEQSNFNLLPETHLYHGIALLKTGSILGGSSLSPLCQLLNCVLHLSPFTHLVLEFQKRLITSRLRYDLFLGYNPHLTMPSLFCNSFVRELSKSPDFLGRVIFNNGVISEQLTDLKYSVVLPQATPQELLDIKK